MLHLLGLINGAVHHKGHGVHRVLGDGDRDHLVLLDIADGVGVGVARRTGLIQRAIIYLHSGLGHCVLGVHGDGEGEAAVIVHRGAAASGGHSSVAGAVGQGHGEGVDLPHSVQGDITLGGVHITGLVSRCRGSSSGAPAQEGVAITGGNLAVQSDRRTVGLGGGRRHIAHSLGTRILIICNGIGLGGQLGVNGHVIGDRGSVSHRCAGAVLLSIPTVKGVTIHNGGVRQGADLLTAGHLLGGVLGIVYHIGDGVAGDRVHHDLNSLGGGDVFDLVRPIGLSSLLCTIDVHALDLVAGRGRHGEGVAAVVVHAGGSSGRNVNAIRRSDLRGEVAHGHHDGVGQQAGVSKGNIN